MFKIDTLAVKNNNKPNMEIHTLRYNSKIHQSKTRMYRPTPASINRLARVLPDECIIVNNGNDLFWTF